MASQPSDTQVTSSRERLLQAAKRLFAANGYEQTATSAIARAAGTSESQLMRYFGGKVGLLEALFDEAWSDLNGRVEKVVAAQRPERETIVEVLQTISTALARDADLALLFLFEVRRLRGEEPRVRLSRGFLVFADVVRGLVKRGQTARAIDPALDAGAVTSALLGAAEAMIRDRVLARAAGSRGYPERELARTLDAMLIGFSPGTVRGRRAVRGVAPRGARRAK
jgi:AcrR family transcriptional regulator